MASTSDLIERLTTKLEYLSEEDAKIAVESIFTSLASNLQNNNRIEIRGFGSFSIRERKYALSDVGYNSVYYRMSKNIFETLNRKDS